jgi:hypothetical protein
MPSPKSAKSNTSQTSPDLSDQPSSPPSPPKKTSSAKAKEPATQRTKLHGSESSATQKRLESGSAPSSKPINVEKVPKDRAIKVDRDLALLKRLGVSEESLDQAPQITPLLKKASGGLKAVLSALRLAQQDEVIKAFLAKYDSLSLSDRERVPWEAVGLSAEIDLNHLLGSAMLALTYQSASVAKIIAVTSQPKITKARVKYGMLAGGEKDRTAIDMANGVLAQRQGPTFIGKAMFGAPGGAQMPEEGEDETETPVVQAPMNPEDQDVDDLFPSPKVMQDKLVAIRNRLLGS